MINGPEQTFNIAGLCSSFAIIPDSRLRFKLQQAMRGLMADNNLIGLVAAEAAYEHGDEWLQAQIEYLRASRDLVEKTLGCLPRSKSQNWKRRIWHGLMLQAWVAWRIYHGVSKQAVSVNNWRAVWR